MHLYATTILPHTKVLRFLLVAVAMLDGNGKFSPLETTQDCSGQVWMICCNRYAGNKEDMFIIV